MFEWPVACSVVPMDRFVSTWLALTLVACSESADPPAGAVDTGTVETSTGDTGTADVRDDGVDAPTDTPTDVARALPPGRATSTACTATTPRPAGNAGADGGVDAGADAAIECKLDVDCTTGAGGRCNELKKTIFYGGGSLGTRCTYDVCTKDSDCGAKGVCECGIGFAGQNLCLSLGDCRTDADCASGQVCALSKPFILPTTGFVRGDEVRPSDPSGPDEALGRFCTTVADECRPGEKAPFPSDGCVFSPSRKHWVWWYQP